MAEKNNKILAAPPAPGFPRLVGKVEVDNPVWLAPLAGISYASFRRFHRSLGAGLTHTEMVSALGLKYKGRKTKELLSGGDGDEPCVLQLFGSNAEDISTGADIALRIRSFAALEVNMACPMPKVTKKGSGAALLENAETAAGIIKALKSFALPVWAKMRLLPQDARLSTEEFCSELIDAGADLIFLHGRTPAQRYEGRASKEAVIDAARRFPGMIGGSGDCSEPEDLISYLDGGCVSVLAARGVLRDATLIPRTLALIGADVPEEMTHPSQQTQKEMLLRLCRGICEVEGERPALGMAKRMCAAIFKGFAGAPALRNRCASAGSWRMMEEMLADFPKSEQAAEYKSGAATVLLPDNY